MAAVVSSENIIKKFTNSYTEVVFTPSVDIGLTTIELFFFEIGGYTVHRS